MHRRLAVDLSVEERPCAKIGRPSSTCPLFPTTSGQSPVYLLLVLLLATLAISGKAQTPKPDWKTQVAEAMPLLGHRNWVLIVDSAYPLETARGIETVETNADELSVVRSVLETINSSRHVRPVITLDSELAFVPDQDAPGASAYRQQIGKILQGYDVQSQPHDAILKSIDKEGRTFRVLVLKTNMAIPYTSVFIRLDCKYWSADAEKRLRAKMGTASKVKSKHDGSN
jgi:hypothetical protein